MTEPTTTQRKRLRAHFGFTKTPFHKAMRAAQMYDSQSQRELVAGLEMWTEVGGIALCTGGYTGAAYCGPEAEAGWTPHANHKRVPLSTHPRARDPPALPLHGRARPPA